MTASPPNPDQVEVTLFGPGIGECCLIHLGDYQWAVVDSCVIGGYAESVALSYLREIGMEPSNAVRLVVATNWHDDHIRGLASLLESCPMARFCCSSALTQLEFLATVLPYERRNLIAGGSGVTELFEVLRTVERPRVSGRGVIRASANRRIFFRAGSESGSGSACEVWTLSPSDRQIEMFYRELTRLMPSIRETKRRVVAQRPNHTSVVTWIRIGGSELLLGADLEETGDPETGWTVIVNSTDRPQGRAQVFKVAHHGSANGHHPGVWERMLIKHPFAILAPYNRGRKKLPDKSDVGRITALTPHAYSSSRITAGRTRLRRPAPVERTVRETVGFLKGVNQTTSRITLRNGGAAGPATWDVRLTGQACNLLSVHDAH